MKQRCVVTVNGDKCVSLWLFLGAPNQPGFTKLISAVTPSMPYTFYSNTLDFNSMIYLDGNLYHSEINAMAYLRFYIY